MPLHGESRRGGDIRDDSFASGGGGHMSRAERFEDEKRRIMRSCFSKMDGDGVGTYAFICYICVLTSPPDPHS